MEYFIVQTQDEHGCVCFCGFSGAKVYSIKDAAWFFTLNGAQGLAQERNGIVLRLSFEQAWPETAAKPDYHMEDVPVYSRPSDR
jgi:hypothetical protein